MLLWPDARLRLSYCLIFLPLTAAILFAGGCAVCVAYLAM